MIHNLKLRKSEIIDLQVIKSWLRNKAEAEAWAGPNIHFPIDLDILQIDINFKNAAPYSLISDGNQLMGFAQIHDKFDCHHIGHVIVDPQIRHNKIGFKLLSALLSIPYKDEKDHSLFVIKHNIPAMTLYQKLGFTPAAWPRNTPKEIENCQFMKKTPRVF